MEKLGVYKPLTSLDKPFRNTSQLGSTQEPDLSHLSRETGQRKPMFRDFDDDDQNHLVSLQRSNTTITTKSLDQVCIYLRCASAEKPDDFYKSLHVAIRFLLHSVVPSHSLVSSPTSRKNMATTDQRPDSPSTTPAVSWPSLGCCLPWIYVSRVH